MGDRVSQQLGNYRILRLLGQGGFADVYLGEHVHLHTQAAIKVLQMRLGENNIQNFLNEARTIAHLVHPYIIRVLDFGVQNNVPFLVMDYAPKGTFRQRFLQGRPLPPAPLVPYIKQAAAALQYGHDKKLIHRDVKPENMLLGPNDEVLLSDFGLALFAHNSISRSTTEAAGTAAYMAPEQLQGKPRPASDQYALGVIAYEWMSGVCPFQGTFFEIASQQVLAPVPKLRDKNPAIPAAIETVIMTALEKEPQKRFPTVREFALALEDACLSSQQYSFDISVVPASPSQTPQASMKINAHEMPSYTSLSASEIRKTMKPRLGPMQSSMHTLPPVQTPTTSQMQTPQASFNHTNMSTNVSGDLLRQMQSLQTSNSNTPLPTNSFTLESNQPKLRTTSSVNDHIRNLSFVGQPSDMSFIDNAGELNKRLSEPLITSPTNTNFSPTTAGRNQSAAPIKFDINTIGLKQSTFLLIMAAGLIILGGLLALLIFNTGSNPAKQPSQSTVTVVHTKPSPTATTDTVNKKNPYLPNAGTFFISDPLKENKYGWTEGAVAQTGGSCAFSKDGYTLTTPMTTPTHKCLAGTSLSNFTMEVDMQFTDIDLDFSGGGIVFRYNQETNQYYTFKIGKDGRYEVRICDGVTDCQNGLLSAYGNVVSSFKTTPNAVNKLAVVAQNNEFTFYVNGEKVETITDPNTTLTQGSIGLFVTAGYDATNKTDHPTTAVFSKLRIWKL